MIWRRQRQLALSMLVLCLACVPVSAITLQLDYTYDTNNFFAPGSQARVSLEAAAGFFSDILNDTFSSIQTPPPFSSPNGSNVTWQWTMNFTNPSGTNSVVRTNQTVAANQYIIYAGARNLSGNTLGVGGPGGYTWNVNGSVHPADESEVQQITDNFIDAVERRGESSGFARWGGTISFDTVPPSPWNFNHTVMPAGNVSDFYSVAIHEFAHALGFGEEDSDPSHFTDWESYVSAGSATFLGSNASATYGGSVPLAPSPDLSHWANGTASVMYGTSNSQETAMDPSLTTGTRKFFTALDAAAMQDIGWTVVALSGVNGDYNNNRFVDAADYVIWRKRLGQSVTIPNDATPGTVTASDFTVWRNNFGDSPFYSSGAGAGSGLLIVPEPGGFTLFLLGCIAVRLSRRKRCG